MEAQCSFIYTIAKLPCKNREHYKIFRCYIYIYMLLNMRKILNIMKVIKYYRYSISMLNINICLRHIPGKGVGI